MAYADYEFYTTAFYGSAIGEADFPRLSLRASDFIDYYTRGKAAKAPAGDAGISQALAKCCCAVAEQMLSDERDREIRAKAQAAALASGMTGEVKSESVGSWSVSYATAGDYVKSGGAAEAAEDARGAYAAIAREYLVHTGLLYRGGRR